MLSRNPSLRMETRSRLHTLEAVKTKTNAHARINSSKNEIAHPNGQPHQLHGTPLNSVKI